MITQAMLALSWVLSAIEPSQEADASTDTAQIVGLLIEERLHANGEAPPGSYLVLSADTIVLCPAEGGEEDDALVSRQVLDQPAVLPKAPAALKMALFCQGSGGVLPPGRYAHARLIWSDEFAAIFSGKGWWEDFYATFPDSRGYVEFTLPVFSPDRTQALLYVSHSCGGLCGTGWLVYLTKAAGRWSIADKTMLWIS